MNKTNFEIDIQINRDIIILTTKTIEFLLTQSPDSLSLYIFYTKNASIQKTNTIWNTNTFGMNGLGWGKDRYNRAKKILVDNGFIEEIIRRNDKGQVIGHYLNIKYIFGRETINNIINQKHQNLPVDETTSGFQETNALSNKNINALSNKKEILQPEVESPFSLEEELVKLESSSWKPNKILALYFRFTKLQFQNKKQFTSEIKKQLRGAIALEGYNSNQLIATMEYCEKNYKDISWNLYTVGKRIALIINGKI